MVTQPEMSQQRRKTAKWLHSIDMFPKVDRELQASTESGGLVSLVLAALLGLLVLSEFLQYRRVVHVSCG